MHRLSGRCFLLFSILILTPIFSIGASEIPTGCLLSLSSADIKPLLIHALKSTPTRVYTRPETNSVVVVVAIDPTSPTVFKALAAFDRKAVNGLKIDSGVYPIYFSATSSSVKAINYLGPKEYEIRREQLNFHFEAQLELAYMLTDANEARKFITNLIASHKEALDKLTALHISQNPRIDSAFLHTGYFNSDPQGSNTTTAPSPSRLILIVVPKDQVDGIHNTLTTADNDFGWQLISTPSMQSFSPEA